MTRRRVGLILLPLLAALIVGGFFAAGESPDTGWVTSADRRAQLSLDRPQAWRLERYGVCLRSGPGVLVSNTRVRSKAGCEGDWDLRGLPTTLVAVQAGRIRLSSAPDRQAVTRLPLSLARAPVTRLRDSGWRGTVRSLLVARGNRTYYVVREYTGDDATMADRVAAARVVSSIRFNR